MNSNKIDGGREFNWGFTSGQYAKYRDIYPNELYDRLRKLGVAADGTSWLDLGTGTGILPMNLYNPNAEIVGVDISDEQIRFARQTAKENGWNIRYFASPAETTGLPDNSFDSITAAQCFWYFDREAMKSEISRMLKPGGIMIKIFLDWDYDDELAAKSIDLVKKFNPEWNPTSYGPADMADNLFDGKVEEQYECDIPFTRESWHGRMCACRGTLASMTEDAFEKWCSAHNKMLMNYPEKFTVKHKLYITYYKAV